MDSHSGRGRYIPTSAILQAQEARVPLKRPVLVLGWIPRIVVTIARSLQKHGVPVDVADFVRAARPSSRAIRNSTHIPRPDIDSKGFVNQLRHFIRRGGHDMVIPTDDQTLVALTEHYQDLSDLAYIACPPPEITRPILDKYLSLDIAEKCGIRIPKTRLISHSDQLFDLLSDLSFPLVLKPARKEVRLEEVKSITLRTAGEVAARFPSPCGFMPPMLLQEYCAGAGVGVEMLMHQGKSIAVFQHRRLKELPYTGGVSVTAVAEQPSPDLVEKSLAILRALRWEGPAMVEFKVNRQNGSAIFMEVNGRYWGTIGLPIFAGINFPLYHWQLVHGEIPIVPGTYEAGIKWLWMVGHVQRLHSLLIAATRRSPRAWNELLHSLEHIPSPFSASICRALFSASDPIPAVLEWLHICKFLLLYDVKASYRRFAARLGFR